MERPARDEQIWRATWDGDRINDHPPARHVGEEKSLS